MHEPRTNRGHKLLSCSLRFRKLVSLLTLGLAGASFVCAVEGAPVTQSGAVLPALDQLPQSRLTDSQLQQQLLQNPGDRNAMFVVAARAYLAGDVERALPVFDRLHNLDSNFPPASIAGALLLVDAGKLSEAEELIEELQKKDEYPVWTLVALADIALMSRKMGDVDTYIEKARSADPSSEIPVAYLARIELRRGREFEAVELFEEASQLAPKRLDLLDQVSAVWFNLGYPERARKSLQAAAARDGSRENPALSLARLYWQSTDAVSAAEMCEEVLEQDPADVDARLLLAQARIALGERESADSLLHELLAENAELVRAAVLLADSLANRRLWEEALPLYEKVYRQAPGNPLVANNLAAVLLEMNEQPQRALDLAATAAQQLPNHGKVLATLGWAKWQTGQTAEAEQDLRRAVRLAPKDPWARWLLGKLLIELDQTDQAIRHWQVGLQLNPDEVLSEMLHSLLTDHTE